MLHFMEEIIPLIVHLLEAMGLFVITFTGIKAFIQYAMKGFNFAEDTIKIELAKALALGLEFFLAGEIIKTLTIHSLKEVYVLGAIMALRVALTFVIHWEVTSDSKHCNDFLKLKKQNNTHQEESKGKKHVSA